jgi:hypothetical protein
LLQSVTINRLEAVAGLTQYGDSRLATQNQRETIARDRVIVREDDRDGAAGRGY